MKTNQYKLTENGKTFRIVDLTSDWKSLPMPNYFPHLLNHNGKILFAYVGDDIYPPYQPGVVYEFAYSTTRDLDDLEILLDRGFFLKTSPGFYQLCVDTKKLWSVAQCAIEVKSKLYADPGIVLQDITLSGLLKQARRANLLTEQKESDANQSENTTKS